MSKGLSIVLLATVSLTGCGVFFGEEGMFRNRGKDYLKSEEIPPITLPPGVRTEALGTLYAIPPIPETSLIYETEGAPRPQSLSTNLLEEEVKIQSLSGRRWILINRSPSEVWPRVRSILNNNRVPIAVANATAGVIETGWLQFDDDQDHDHRFRFTIAEGIQTNSTEVAILHASKPRGGPSPEWPQTSMSDVREQNMTRVLASSLSADATKGTVSLLAQTIGGGSKVEIVTPLGADPFIRIKLDYDRAWASVGYSVSKEEFDVVDQDRSTGVLYVLYKDKEEREEDKPGFIARLFGRDQAQERPAANYQVRLTKGDSGVEVRIYGSDQASLKRSESLRLLKKIRANLS